MDDFQIAKLATNKLWAVTDLFCLIIRVSANPFTNQDEDLIKKIKEVKAI